jgi:Cu+-exporting ATPase
MARTNGPESTANIDPVCGMEVAPAEAAAESNYKGRIYYFCSETCKEDFDQDPEEYID